MSVFTDPELAYLTSDRRLARIARPRAIEVRGRAEAIEEPEATIRIHPERIVSWGLESQRSARTVIG
jgi:pyridoxamine 5'-phosphate oxidase family protein